VNEGKRDDGAEDVVPRLTGTARAAARELPDLFNVRIARHWWAMALRGAVAILFGLLVLAWPPVALLTFALLFGVYCLIDAVLSAILAVRGARLGGHWGSLAFNALLGLSAGGIALLYPGITMLAFALLLGAWAVFAGGLAIIAAFRLRRDHGRVWMILGGLAALTIGIFALTFPPLALLWLIWMIAIEAFFVGFMLLAAAFRLRARQHERAARTRPAIVG
jgi:uncharacterized membrane protein HdeD (DUF308 family)